MFRIVILILAVGTRADLFTAPDIAEEIAALDRDDFVAYAALHGMNLGYYNVVTTDGWILQLWRVRSLQIFDDKLSAPVIISHGFGSSSFDYMLNLRNQSIPFILADNGYDVWLTNYRANQFSNRILSNGTRRRPHGSEYYKGVWQYMAEIDFPTIVDKVLSETNQSKVYLIGHSMGTTIPFAFLSENRSFDEKISHFAAVVPVLKFGDDTSFWLRTAITVATPLVHLLPERLFRLVFGTQIGASDKDGELLDTALELTACTVLPPLCFLVYNLMFTRSLAESFLTNPHLNRTRGKIYFSKTPAGVAPMNAYNYAMQWKKDPWTKIDFNRVPQTHFTNMGEYNMTEPPAYDFGNIKVPFSMLYVKNDVFTGPKTAQEVVAELRATDVKFIDGNNLDHADSVVGIDTRCYTLDDIMSKFENIETARDDDHKNYRDRVRSYVDSLPFENGCANKNR